MPQGKNWTRDHPRSVVGTFDKHVVFGGLWVQFSPRVRRFSLSRAIMISPPSKLKIFTGSVCVLLIKINKNKNKNKINFRNHKFVREKQNGGWKLSDTNWFYFSLYSPSCFFFIIRVFFLWSELIRVQFYFILFFSSIRVDPSWSDPDWQSELIRSNFCTCLLKA